MKNISTLIITVAFTISIFLLGCLENVVIPEPSTDPDTALSGTVSGTVTDAQTVNPIPGVVIRFSDLETEADTEGNFTFYGIPYIEHELTINDPDYQKHAQIFTLNKELLELKIELTPRNNAKEELDAFLEDFSELVLCQYLFDSKPKNGIIRLKIIIHITWNLSG